jgi:hypothetical protein
VRVQASCMGLGQAAGAAAAIAAGNKEAFCDVDTDRLREILVGYGTNLTK